MDLVQKNPLNTSEFHYICARCCSDFIVPSNALNSLMVAATHCAGCVSYLSETFSAYFSKAGK